jgi:DICT domain-containing protein
MLRERHPDLPAQRLSKATLLGLTHAVEDEYLARAEKAVLFGFFQRERYYRGAETRWHALAHAADFAAVLADFEGHGSPHASPMEVDLAPESPMRREWVLLCDGPGMAACVAGWERPGQDDTPDADRDFEVVWTLEPQVVRNASRLCLQHLDDLDQTTRSTLEDRLADQPAAASGDLRRANAVFRRLVGYLDERG